VLAISFQSRSIAADVSRLLFEALNQKAELELSEARPHLTNTQNARAALSSWVVVGGLPVKR